jgi:mannose-1-phosphate guanylyltransferase
MILIPTILCGGAGSRLWPLSRSLHPKPFIRLNDGQSLLQKAFPRGSEQNHVHEILTVTNREFLFKTEDDYREVNKKNISTSFILEPFAKNTAAAIAAATLNVLENHGEEAYLLVLAADHLIKDGKAFKASVDRAIKLAEKNNLVTFGIQPTTPETGYGYIEAEENTVKRFIEKPDLLTAKEYLASGKFLWNSGMFCFRAGVMLKEMEQHCPDILMLSRVA